ncbi:MAG: RloB family protein, partial [Methylobacteriaceae bacterium]|nr:RloB family protein [Methylobacteriaceae bacterium]
KAADAAGLRRPGASRRPHKRVLIVCEGKKTEKRYFDALIADLRLSGIQVEVVGDSPSAPKGLVQFAEKKAQAEGPPSRGGYAKIFCVFDRDTHETFDEAVSRVGNLNRSTKFPAEIAAIVSNPCFEFWFILHHRYLRAPFAAASGRTAAENVVECLRAIEGYETYAKAISEKHIHQLLPLTDQAVGNAGRALADADMTGEPNPSTHVFKIINYLTKPE